MLGSRAQQISSFIHIKGALIPETYAAFQHWDCSISRTENLRRLKEANPIGAKSASWLHHVAKALSRRFDPQLRDRPLIELAKANCSLDIWKPILLWHVTRDEFLLRDFLLNWLFPAFESDAYRLQSEDLIPYLQALPQVKTDASWSDNTLRRVANGLLQTAVDFGLLKGTVTKEFTSYHLPEPSFLYILHALASEQANARKVIDSPEWRMYLLQPADVENELFRLHQYRQLDYEVAGSLSQLRLPYASAAEYARELAQ